MTGFTVFGLAAGYLVGERLEPRQWLGDLMMIGAALAWAATTLTIKASALNRISPEKTLLYQLAVAIPILTAGALMFGVVLLFNPLREWVRRAVDRTFFRERYDYARTIHALARSMASLLDLDEIRRLLTTTIESAMHVRSARLLLEGLPADVVAALQVTPSPW